MLFAVLSPAKRLDFSPAPAFARPSTPALLDKTAVVVARAKKLTRGQIAKLMDISAKLAELNFERFQKFDPAGGTGKPAIYAFAGDVYMGFDAKTLSEKDIAFAQEHIGIISGLYGLLRPLDAIQPYRLEMGSALKNERGKDLHAFWRKSLTDHINTRTSQKGTTIVNLASQEYWGAVDEKALKAPVLSIHFKEIKNGKASIVAFFAKKARGMMARHIAEKRLTKPEQLKTFDTGGYRFDASVSDAAQWVFSRPFIPMNAR